MKTYRNLFTQLCEFENLYLAYRAARKGKTGKAACAFFSRRWEEELFALQTELQEQPRLTTTPVFGPWCGTVFITGSAR